MDWEMEIWGNSLLSYMEAVTYFAVLWIGFYVVQWVVLARLDRWAQKTVTDIDNTAIRIVKSVKPPIVFVLSIYLAAQALVLSGEVERVINISAVVVLSAQVIFMLQILMDYLIRRRLKRNIPEDAEETGQDKQNVESALRVMNQIGRFILWSVGLLFVLSNVGVNITSLVASLGIGGIAVALAAQNVLGDLFSSLAIYFDKPFVVGDFIIAGDTMGTVKYIGIKTTRIKALSGEEVVLPNQDITNARIQNYKRMEERRVPFKIGVLYETPAEKLEKIPKVVEEVVTALENVRFSRAHFESFGDSALVFEIVYFVTDPSYELYMDIQQKINLELKRRFEEMGVQFAYPTQTVHIAKN